MPTKLDNYIVGRTLGKGAFAKVKQATDLETGEEVAIKIMKLENGTRDEAEEAIRQITNEFDKLASLNHNFIISILQTVKESFMNYDDGRSKPVIYVVLELATGGLLFDYIYETK